MKYLLVANPTAQSGRAQKRIDRTLNAIAARGIAVDFLSTLPGGATLDAVAEAVCAQDYDVCIYLGGDGTFHEVAGGLVHSGRPTPLGMMPSGTANNQGLSFGVRADPDALEENLDVVGAGHITLLDAGRIQRLGDEGSPTAQALFFDSAGWGLQAGILATRNQDRSAINEVPLLRDIYRDKAVYVGAAVDQLLQSLVEPVTFSAEVRVDGEALVMHGLMDLILNATDMYAGSWILDRLSEPDDGIFELVPVRGRAESVVKAVSDHAALPVWKEHLELVGVSLSQSHPGRVFELSLSRPDGDGQILTQVDGEQWVSGNEFRVEVLQGALPLITPADWEAPWSV